MAQTRTLCDGEDQEESVFSLASWKGHLISGHDSVILVWNVVTRVCDQVLEGHTNYLICLAVSKTRLAS